jgi:hypothetical protein
MGTAETFWAIVCPVFRKDYSSFGNSVAVYNRIMGATQVQYRPQVTHG